jgi:hypothetical protein
VHTLALDPGITTGWALIDDDGRLEGCGNFLPEDLHDGLDFLIRKVNRTGDELEVVQEHLAYARMSGSLGINLRYVLEAIDRVIVGCYDLKRVFVTPGQWKTSAVAAQSRPEKWDGQPLTQHQKDAIGIAWYRLSKRGRSRPFTHERLKGGRK